MKLETIPPTWWVGESGVRRNAPLPIVSFTPEHLGGEPAEVALGLVVLVEYFNTLYLMKL